MPIFNEYGKIKQVILGISTRIYPDYDFPEEMIEGFSLLTKIQFKILSIISNHLFSTLSFIILWQLTSV